MVVLPDADLDAVADAAVSAGFGSAGERCMAISVLVAVDPVGDELVAKIADRTGGIASETVRRAPRRRGGEADMGPLVTREHADRVLDSSGRARSRRDARGRRSHPRGGGEADGFWLGPTCSTTCRRR